MPQSGDFKAVLKEYFGYDSFRGGQKQVVEAILSGRDCMVVMPTGAGKSLCFQVPAMLLSGIVLVVSPLISLMKDQVDSLGEMGIPAAFINSSLSAKQLDKTLEDMRLGVYKLIYIAPERLESERFLAELSSINVSLVAVDEAHCISQWGHDFRPSYCKVGGLIKQFATRPVVAAFTATATTLVHSDIMQLLQLRSPLEVTTGYDRPNLFFEVDSTTDKNVRLLGHLRENAGTCGVVYCTTRKGVEQVAAMLCSSGFKAVCYHAGMPDAIRIKNQEDFIYDRVDIIVATNAFGMGIDKSNVRFVVHYNMPRTVESYYQEAGRAGRDGQKSHCLLLYSASDIMIHRFLIERSDGKKDKEYDKLQQMIDYCNSDDCLRAYILRYFGEKPGDDCANCSTCVSGQKKTDITTEAQKILSCVKRMGERFGTGLVVDVLRGSRSKKVLEMGFDQLTTYGIMKEQSSREIKAIIGVLTSKGFLQVESGEFPIVKVSSSGMAFLKERRSLFTNKKVDVDDTVQTKRTSHSRSLLFERLRQCRKAIALEQEVAPFMVFSDASLESMCEKLPRTLEEFSTVSGVGKFKLEQYGDEFLDVIVEYILENGEPENTYTSAPIISAKGKEEPSFMATYRLAVEGYSIEEICQRRSFVSQTIEGHLLVALRSGYIFDYSEYLSKDQYDIIAQLLSQTEERKLSVLKLSLPEEIDYFTLRLAVWDFENEGILKH